MGFRCRRSSLALAAIILSIVVIFIGMKASILHVWLPASIGKVRHPVVPDIHTDTASDTSRKKSILLFVGIYSAPIRTDRRNAVRETWMQLCRANPKVVCWFITDKQDTTGKTLVGTVREKLENESKQHGDLVLADSPGGINFGRRYLWMAKWASERYNFEYIFRVDDDYFVCFDRLLNELQFHRPKQRFTWGWLHCRKGVAATDEGFVIITHDLVKLWLSKINTTLLCHPYGGQNIGIWLNGMENVTTFGDNKRLFHLNYDNKVKAAKRTEVCHTALGIHKSYPAEMRLYWKVYQKEDKTVPYEVPEISFPCSHPRVIDYKLFNKPFFAEPKLCKTNPIWNMGEFFKGRQRK